MKFRSFLPALILCLLTTSLLARPGTVRTKDGRSIEGDITDKGTEGAVISTRAGQITIRADEIAEIQYGSNIKEAYEKRLAALPKDAGAPAHVDLARWLYENKEYDLARKELDTALTIDPNNQDANVLRQTVDRTMLLDKRPGTAPPPRQPAAAGTGAAGAAAPNKAVGGTLVKDRHVLSAEQINIIKQAELRNDEQRVRVRLENNVAKKYVESANMDPREFAAMPDAAKAFNILKYGAPELRKDVKIVTDPQPLIEFKSKVQPALLQSCATSACHGGTTAGRFLLYNPADNDSVSYTNFYTLTQFTSNIEGTQRRMIDRLYPQNSLILQFALPRDRAEFDHPEAAGWKAVFSGTQDNRYFLLLDWVKNALVPIQPNYGIDFTLPTTKAPATQPTQPSQPAAPADQKPAAGQGAQGA